MLLTNKHSIIFQQNWSGCPGLDVVVLLLEVYRFFRLFLLCAEEKVFSSLDPSRGSSRRFARRRLVWAKSKQNGMRECGSFIENINKSNSNFPNKQKSYFLTYLQSRPRFLFALLQFVGGGHTTFCGFLNCFVHVVMYSYYFLAGKKMND